MFQFDPNHYDGCSQLLANAPSLPLGPGRPHQNGADALGQLQSTDVGPREEMARCCLSGLWLRHGFLEPSHEISQTIQSPEGSYWHGIMHRHEPDYSNAKYWFRQVGNHDLYPSLGENAARIASRFPEAPAELTRGSWDPFDFIDLCEQQEDGGPYHDLCVAVVQLEWEMLFDYCYQAANDR